MITSNNYPRAPRQPHSGSESLQRLNLHVYICSVRSVNGVIFVWIAASMSAMLLDAFGLTACRMATTSPAALPCSTPLSAADYSAAASAALHLLTRRGRCNHHRESSRRRRLPTIVVAAFAPGLHGLAVQQGLSSDGPQCCGGGGGIAPFASEACVARVDDAVLARFSGTPEDASAEGPLPASAASKAVSLEEDDDGGRGRGAAALGPLCSPPTRTSTLTLASDLEAACILAAGAACDKLSARHASELES